MKNVNIFLKAIAALMIIAALFINSSCSNGGDRVTVSRTELDSLRNQIRGMTAGNEVLAKNLATFDTLDYTVFSNQAWTRLHESHSKDVRVNWPDGHFTTGIEKHIQDLSAMFVYAPDTRIKQHPVRFGSSNGEWTAVTGVFEGTFTKPMPTGNGKFIQPTGKAFKMPMCTIGHWKDGVMFEEYLFWDNMTYMNQMDWKLMNRRTFISAIAMIPITGAAMKLNELNKLTSSFETTAPMPVLFVGHGSPMNAIEENEFVRGWRTVGKTLPRPAAILCISAHWETRGVFVTAMEKPRTIHDFGGFPQELFAVEYPAPGSPELAKEVSGTLEKAQTGLDEKWGLDHGCWSVLKQMYPEADVPVIQLSLDYSRPASYHYDLAKELAPLRKKGVLILGSGNMVHNLRLVAWDRMNDPEYGFDWAIEASEKMKRFILAGDHQSLVNWEKQGKAFNLAIPTPEHFLPLLYALALKGTSEKTEIFNDRAVMGSLTMTSLRISG